MLPVCAPGGRRGGRGVFGSGKSFLWKFIGLFFSLPFFLFSRIGLDGKKKGARLQVIRFYVLRLVRTYIHTYIHTYIYIY